MSRLLLVGSLLLGLVGCAAPAPTPPETTPVYAEKLNPGAAPLPVEKVSISEPEPLELSPSQDKAAKQGTPEEEKAAPLPEKDAAAPPEKDAAAPPQKTDPAAQPQETDPAAPPPKPEGAADSKTATP